MTPLKGTEAETMDEIDERNELSANDGLSDETPEEVDALSQFYGSVKDVVTRYTHCSHCGGNLHFTYITDFSRNLTQEMAKCPECGIKVRKLIHRLQ